MDVAEDLEVSMMAKGKDRSNTACYLMHMA